MDELSVALANIHSCIGFHPIDDEPDFREAPLPPRLFRNMQYVPPNQKNDPIEWARRFTQHYGKGERPCVFVPGRSFDAFGDRHGRGNGWYDRFLTNIPPSWIRIGVTRATRFSLEPIERKEWDQPCDWVIIEDHGVWGAVETHARD